MRCVRRLSHLWCSSVSGWNRRRRGKNMRATRPHTPRQVRITCTTAKQVCRLIKIVWYRGAASAAIQLRKLVVHSTKSPAGAVQSAQWRELDLSSSRAPAEFPAVMRCPVGSRTFVPRPLAVGTADGGEEARPQTPRQGETSLPSYSIAQKEISGRIFRIFFFYILNSPLFSCMLPENGMRYHARGYYKTGNRQPSGRMQ